jgi:hypothetical protein
MTKAILKNKMMKKEYHFIQEDNKCMIREICFEGKVVKLDITCEWDKEAANAYYLRLINNKNVERVQ